MRREEDSLAMDIVMLAAKLPWWACLILAFVSYLIMHGIAGIEVAKPTGTGTMGDFAVKQMFITLAWFGQMVLPGLFVIAGIGSGLKSLKQDRSRQ